MSPYPHTHSRSVWFLFFFLIFSSHYFFGFDWKLFYPLVFLQYMYIANKPSAGAVVPWAPEYTQSPVHFVRHSMLIYATRWWWWWPGLVLFSYRLWIYNNNYNGLTSNILQYALWNEYVYESEQGASIPNQRYRLSSLFSHMPSAALLSLFLTKNLLFDFLTVNFTYVKKNECMLRTSCLWCARGRNIILNPSTFA